MSTAIEPLVVQLPPGRTAERSYAVRLLLERVMGLRIHIQPEHIQPEHIHPEASAADYRLLLPGGRVLSIGDVFFRRLAPQLPLYAVQHLPQGPTVLSRAMGPVPYGAEGLHETPEGLHLEADLVGSTFLLATAWEELALADAADAHDAHGRIRPEATWAGRVNLTDRPLVHEWGEALLGLLRRLGYLAEGPARTPAVLPTHDLDQLWFYTAWAKRWAVALGRPLGAWRRYVPHAPNPFAALHAADPYAVVAQLMDAAERASTRAVFFIPGAFQRGRHDAPQPLMGRAAQRLFEQVRARGHMLGFHPSYRSADAPLLWQHELQHVRQATAADVQWLRPHYLRGALQHVWLRAAALGLPNSSSAGYAQRLGFRTGLCIPYPVFSVLTGAELPVMEWPLVAMEVAPFAQRPESGLPSLTPEDLAQQWQRVQHLVRRSRGTWTFDWHNSSVATPAWAPYARTLWESYAL